VSTVSTENNNRLNRDWIDWELARKLRNVVAARTDKNKTKNPLGIGLATMCLTIVNSVNNDKLTAEQKVMIMGDVFAFMTDLLNNGWTAPPPKGKQN
jgi:acyl CoA:acetate/3-ketoacid CoA transferase beta subunit